MVSLLEGEGGQVLQYHIPGLTTQQWGWWAKAARLIRAAPNIGLQATANSLRSFLAAAIGGA